MTSPVTSPTTSIEAVLFDKDGTLFDFHKTWAPWTAGFIRDFTRNQAEAAALAQAMRFDLGQMAFRPDSPLVAGTMELWVQAIRTVRPEENAADLLRRLAADTAAAPQAPAADLRPLLTDLKRRGLTLGVATNDSEAPARAHLAAAGISDMFDFVAGYDSGHGAKPEPGMLLAFAERLNLGPGAVAMVGDSTHDLRAAAAAGMRPVAVLTGPAPQADLEPLAEVVLPSIAALPDWLQAGNATAGMSQTAMNRNVPPV
ncbi:MAG: HAD family hydrolase [Pseudomonadota bacterium]